MRAALCIGIDYYEYADCLEECVIDASGIAKALKTNADGSPNFETIPVFAVNEKSALSSDKMEAYIRKLFSKNYDVALLYYSGHGAVDAHGSFLCGSDVRRPRDGMSMEVLMDIVDKSPARHKIIILDCCHSGKLGTSMRIDKTMLPEDTTIIAACSGDDVSYEGVFTPLLEDALLGGAANLVGEVSSGSLYAYIDKALGFWFQHPVFKANISNTVCLRKNTPPIDAAKLRRITELFPDPGENPDYEFPLDPSYEEDKRDCEDKNHDLQHEADFAVLRDYARLNLVVPVGEQYMYWAAVHSKSCKLTALGRYYWQLVDAGRI